MVVGCWKGKELESGLGLRGNERVHEMRGEDRGDFLFLQRGRKRRVGDCNNLYHHN